MNSEYGYVFHESLGAFNLVYHYLIDSLVFFGYEQLEMNTIKTEIEHSSISIMIFERVLTFKFPLSPLEAITYFLSK